MSASDSFCHDFVFKVRVVNTPPPRGLPPAAAARHLLPLAPSPLRLAATVCRPPAARCPLPPARLPAPAAVASATPPPAPHCPRPLLPAVAFGMPTVSRTPVTDKHDFIGY